MHGACISPRTDTYHSDDEKPDQRNDRKPVRRARRAARAGARRAPRAGGERPQRRRSAARKAALRGRCNDLRAGAGALRVSNAATLTLAEARARLGQRDISADELLQACRARIARWQPRINAFIDTELRHAGAPSGPLAGIPLAHKDMFYRAGRVSNCGSKIRKGWVASQTAAVLERLDAAGAA